MSAGVIPEGVRGRILDCDSHLMLLPEAYTEVLGEEVGRPLRRWAESFVGRLAPAELSAHRKRARRDIWRVKGWLALGADDPGERVQALDLMGVDRQLLFPPVTLPVLHRCDAAHDRARRRWNDFVLEWASSTGGRVRSVAQIALGQPDEALAETRRVLARGARAVEIPFSHPPAGLSPAAPAWDRFYACLAEAGVPLLLHVGGGGLGGVFGAERSLLDPSWGDSHRLRPDREATDPASVGDLGAFGPFDVATIHIAAEVFLSALVLGAVLERHPALHVGVIELGAGWVADWVQRMDAAAAFSRRQGLRSLDELPSAYVRRQVTVTPLYGEPVGRYVERDGLGEVYAFSTDFPHVEGGKDPLGRFGAAVAGLGPEAVDGFFTGNGETLLPL